MRSIYSPVKNKPVKRCFFDRSTTPWLPLIFLLKMTRFLPCIFSTIYCLIFFFFFFSFLLLLIAGVTVLTDGPMYIDLHTHYSTDKTVIFFVPCL